MNHSWNDKFSLNSRQKLKKNFNELVSVVGHHIIAQVQRLTFAWTCDISYGDRGYLTNAYTLLSRNLRYNGNYEEKERERDFVIYVKRDTLSVAHSCPLAIRRYYCVRDTGRSSQELMFATQRKCRPSESCMYFYTSACVYIMCACHWYNSESLLFHLNIGWEIHAFNVCW